MTIHTLYNAVEGPLGFPMKDRQAVALDQILKALPRDSAFAYRKAVVARPPTDTGERSDVSWITTEEPDREKEVVVARGMNDGQFRLNPIVTMQHAYYLPPVGKSLWRKADRDANSLRGIKAKTSYPPKPEGWEGSWPADVAFALIKAGLLQGKSIGFLPIKVHVPEGKEIAQNGWDKVALVIDEWLLLEYACTFMPCQQNAVVEEVSKSAVAIPEDFLKAMGLDPAIFNPSPRLPSQVAPPAGTISFTTLESIENAIKARRAGDWTKLGKTLVSDAIDRARGRV